VVVSDQVPGWSTGTIVALGEPGELLRYADRVVDDVADRPSGTRRGNGELRPSDPPYQSQLIKQSLIECWDRLHISTMPDPGAAPTRR